MPLVVDTGVLYALSDRRDAWHLRCREMVTSAREILLAPVTVLPEICYLLSARLGTSFEQRFLDSVVAGEVRIDHLQSADFKRAREWLQQYPDLGLVDATVAAVAERLKQTRIATTDRRHFGPLRPRHRPHFDLVP